MIQRTCKPPKTNSFFLFGPRGVGKSTLLQESFSTKDTITVDLLDPQLMDLLLLDISRFEALIDLPENRNKRVVVDEIQKLPRLLDVVHSQIQKRKRQFILTGSSARRLKQQGSNLLAGRAWTINLYPFSSSELGEKFDLKQALELGTLPDSYLAASTADAREYLSAYVGTYLEKEIQQEQWVRKLAPFRKFLAVAAQMNGKIINRAAIARDIGVDSVTVENYFEILQDTLLGFYLPAYHTSVRKAQKQAPKFYFADTGIKRALDKTLSVELLPQTVAWGEAFEHFVILEIQKNISYQRLDWTLSYVRTKDDQEIDLIIERPGKKTAMIEIKSKSCVLESDAKTLENLGYDIDSKADKYIFSLDPLARNFGKTMALHWVQGVEVLFS
jgi:uncharacterized protein